MNLKKNYFTILLLTALFIFSSCSDDNSDVTLPQNTNQEEARVLFKKYGWSLDNKEIQAKGIKKDTVSVFRYKNIEELENFLKEIDENLKNSSISNEEYEKVAKSDNILTSKDNDNLKSGARYHRSPCLRGYKNIRRSVRAGCRVQYEFRYGYRLIARRGIYVQINSAVSRGLIGLTYGLRYRHLSFRTIPKFSYGSGVNLPYIIRGGLSITTGSVGGNVEVYRRLVKFSGRFYTCNGRSF